MQKVEHLCITEYWPDYDRRDDADTWLREQIVKYQADGWELCSTVYRPRVPHPDYSDLTLVCEQLTLIFKKVKE